MKRRRARLMKEQAKISKRKNAEKIGNVYKVLFEGLSQESDLLFSRPIRRPDTGNRRLYFNQ